MPSFQELIDELLGKNGPMHYKKLTEEILKVKQTKGKTPDQTILSILSKGKDRYEKVGDGVYRLKAGAEAEARAEAGVEAQAGAKEEDGGTSARADAAAAVTDVTIAKAPDNERTTTTTEQQQQPEGKQKDDGDEDAGQDFEKVASALNKVFQGVGKLFRGYSQYKMAQAVFCGLLTGQPVLVIGDHASMKSSLSDFIGKKLFDKPVVRLSESFSSPDELRAWTERKVASALSVDPDLLERNLLDGVIVEYSEYGGKVHCRVAIDAVKHPAASRLGEPKREPIWYYSKQVTDQDSPEDILGYTITHPALLGMRPPHMVKEGRLTGADFIFLDELFSSPILVAHLHRALNEKVTDTELGQAEFRPLGLTAASNPFTSNYATNPKIMNFATFDRYAFSAETTAASTAEVLAMVSELKSREVKRLPVELIYAARELLDQVAVPEKLLHFAVVLVAHLSRCYFSTSQAERRMEAVSPFLLEGRDCQACIYSGYPCSIANITRTRAIINIERGMRALALLNGRKEATEEDLLNALLMVLPYRALWNNQEFVTAAGSPYNAAKELISTFAAEVAKRKQGFEEIAQLYSTPDPGLAAELRKKYTDDVLLRSFIDEMVDQMKEAARKKSDQKTLQLLSKPIDLKDAMEVLK
jgi:hypothetical protein